ncbi:MAG: RibD family protein [Steroidobacteraceae bacterium]
MRVVVSVAMSLDGFIDDSGPQRLVLSSPEDFDAVYRLRAQSDVILVGGGTVRADNPSLATRRDKDFALRRQRGVPPHPLKATITRTGDLPSDAKFFSEGNGQKLVFCGAHADSRLEGRLGPRATVVRFPDDEVRAGSIIQDLDARGASQVMIEGGARTIALFLQAGMVDVVRLAIAPVTCGASGRVRFLGDSHVQWTDRWRARLSRVEALGDTAVVWYELQRSQ